MLEAISKLDHGRRRPLGFASNLGEPWCFQVLEKLPVAAYTCDKEGLITYFNDAAARLWERTPELNDPKDRYCGSFKLYNKDGEFIPHDACWMARTLHEEREYAGQEILIECAMGKRIHVLAHAKPIYDIDGELLGAVNILVDITEQRRTQEALRQSEREKQGLIEAVSDLLFRLNREGVFLAYHTPSDAILAMPPVHFLGRNIRDTMPAPMAAAALQAMEQALSTQQLAHFEYELEVGGALRFYECRMMPVSAEEVVAAIRDISERKQTEQALHESRELFEAFMQHSPAVAFIKSEDDRLLYINQAFVDQIWDGKPPDWRNRRGEELWPPQMAKELRENDLRILRNMREEVVEETIIKENGKEIWITVKFPLRFRTGELCLAGMALNISERKKAEEERKRLEAQIQHAQKLESLGVLAGGIAHDFNNLLTSMMGYASLALMDLPPESEVASMVQEIEKAALRAADLTRQMLAYSGRGRFVIQVIRLDKVVKEMSQLLGTVISKKATLHLDLGPAVIRADATQIRQVIMNLITNASDALGDSVGVIRVRTGLRHAEAAELRTPYWPHDLPAGEYAFIEVEDSGCGMSEATLNRIFEPFFTTKFTGRGLGLAAVLGIVRAHKGTIKINSRVGHGSLFQVLFPSVAETPVKEGLRRLDNVPRQGHGMILVVDDEASVRTFVSQTLRHAGFEVLEAGDGHAGLSEFTKHRGGIAAVVLDLVMPQMDGVDLLKGLRRLDERVPVLVISGSGEMEAEERLKGAGANGLMAKPLHPEDLVNKVCALLPKLKPDGTRS